MSPGTKPESKNLIVIIFTADRDQRVLALSRIVKRPFFNKNPMPAMSQILDPIPNNQPSALFCCYVNATNQIQVARITNVPNWYFERVVFPGQRLVFEAVPSAQLEIHTGMMASSIISDTIPCEQLSIDPDGLAAGGFISPEKEHESEDMTSQSLVA
nr:MULTISPECIES: DUF1830 domain-containing protein [unclassified Synechocystis]